MLDESAGPGGLLRKACKTPPERSVRRNASGCLFGSRPRLSQFAGSFCGWCGAVTWVNTSCSGVSRQSYTNATGQPCVVAEMAHLPDYPSRGKQVQHGLRSTTQLGFLGQHNSCSTYRRPQRLIRTTTEQLPRGAF